MLATLSTFIKAFYKSKGNCDEYQKLCTFDFISKPQGMINLIDYVFYNSTLKILWCSSRRPQTLIDNVDKALNLGIEIQEDFENGVWRYSFEYSKDFYFTIDSKERIVL